MIPRTPLLDVPPSTAEGNSFFPTTPFTPYPGTFNSSSIPASSSLQGFNATSVPLIQGNDNADDPLINLLNTILRFVDRDCRLVIELAERANAVRSYKRYKGRILNAAVLVEEADGEKADDVKESFDIMGGVIWAEVGKALIEELGSSLFAAGRPDDFQKVSIFSSHRSRSEKKP